MTPTPRSAPRGEIDVGTVPPTRRAAAGSPPRFAGLADAALHSVSRHRPATVSYRTSPAPELAGAGDGSGVSDSIEVPRRSAGCGAGRPGGLPRPLASGQVGAGRVRSGGDPGRDASSALDRVFDNPVVGHASISNSRVCVVVASNQSLYERAGRRRASLSRGGRVDPQSRNGRPARVARRRGPRHRREVCIGVEPVRSATRGLRAPGRRGGRVGVVKPPRARGGCLGVIRHSGVEGCEMSGGAAQRASIPEYPRPRRELKHLSTSRNRKQPRFPQ